jgi:hypothetical protein
MTRIRFASIAIAALGLGAAAAAHARSDVYFSIGVQPQPYYVQPAPVYVQPRPVYVQPQSYYYVQPAQPVYGYGWQHRGWHGHRRGAYGDLDHDGIRNEYDRDRDGDGVRNRYDRAPNNPYRY